MTGIFLIVFSFIGFFVLPRHLEDIGAGRDEIGRIMSMWGWAAIVLILPVGHWLDRIGRKPFAAAGAIAMAAAAVGLARVTEISWVVYALRCLLGTGFIVAYTAAVAMQVDRAPAKDIPRVFLLTGVCALVMHISGPVLGEWLYRHHGFAAFSYTAAAVSLVAAVVFLSMTDIHRPAPREPGSGDGPGEASSLQVIKEKNLLPLLTLNLIEVGSYTAVATFVLVFVRTKGLVSGGEFFIAYPVMAILLRLLFGGVPGRFGPSAAIHSTMVFYILSIALMPLVSEPWHLLLAGAGFGIGVTFVNPVLNALAVQRMGDPRWAGRVNGWFVLAWCIGGTLSPVVFGLVAEAAGYPVMFLSVAALLFAGNVIFAIGERRASPGGGSPA